MSIGPLLRHGDVITITRPPTGSYVNGEFIQSGAPTTFTALVSIQPLTLQEMLALPEGQRTRQHVHVYSDIRLQPTIDNTGQKGDRFTNYDGRIFEVRADGTWDFPNQTRLPHFECIAVQVENDKT